MALALHSWLSNSTSTILVSSTMAAYPIATFHLADKRLCYCLYLALRFWMVISVTDGWQVFVSLFLDFIILKSGEVILIKVSIVHWLATLWERKWILRHAIVIVLLKHCELSPTESQPGRTWESRFRLTSQVEGRMYGDCHIWYALNVFFYTGPALEHTKYLQIFWITLSFALHSFLPLYSCSTAPACQPHFQSHTLS